MLPAGTCSFLLYRSSIPSKISCQMLKNTHTTETRELLCMQLCSLRARLSPHPQDVLREAHDADQGVNHSSTGAKLPGNALCNWLWVDRACQCAAASLSAQTKPEIFAGLDSWRHPSFSGALTENYLFSFPGLLQCRLEPGLIQLHQSNRAPQHDITWHSWHRQVLQTNGHHGSQTIQITFRYISYLSAQTLPSCLFSQLHMNQGWRKEKRGKMGEGKKEAGEKTSCLAKIKKNKLNYCKPYCLKN